MKEINKMKGILTITDKKTGVIELRKENMILNVGKNLVANLLDNTGDFLKSIHIGTSNIIVSATDTNLYSEIYNKDFDSTTVVGNTWSCEIEVGTGDANSTWRELGIKSNLGVLFNRINVSFTKTSAEEKLVKFEITAG